MPIQDEFGRIGFFEDFLAPTDDSGEALSDATPQKFNDILLVPVSGDVQMTSTFDESGGVMSFSGAAGAADGIALVSSPMQPSSNGTLVAGGRFKVSAATDYRAFLGWQETVDYDETVNPFTLSGTTLTSNDGGQAVGFYYDTGATTDDFRLHASSDGTELTTARVRIPNSTTTTLGALGVRCNVTLTADEWMVWRIEIDPDATVRAYFGHDSMANQNGLTLIATIEGGQLDADALYKPIMQLLEESTGDPLHEVDYFYAKGKRDWAS